MFVIASGPLFVEGPTGNVPVKYQNPTIVLNFDQDLSAATNTLVLDAFNMWNSTTTSTVNLVKGTALSVNVTSTNFNNFIPTAGNTAPATDGLNPVVYDADGQIIDLFFGVDSSDDIAGFASSSFFVGSSTFLEGYAVINGKPIGLSDTGITLIIAHELGHFIGLDHTLVDIDEDLTVDMNGQLINACSTKPGDQYPLMFPIVCRNNTSLHQDDIISVSTLYPTTDIDQAYGQVTGKFVQLNDSAILGANIWALSSTNEVYSIVSDYLTGGTGFFSLYLPPDTYTLHANSIDMTFNGASGVGPYAEELTSASFQSPHPITPVSYQGNTGSTETLTITAGQATDVLFKLDGSGVTTYDGPIFTPPTPPTTDNSDDGGGGLLTPTFLALLLLLIQLRLFSSHRNIFS